MIASSVYFRCVSDENVKVSVNDFIIKSAAIALQVRNFVVSFPGKEVIKLFSCSAQLSQKFILLINVKMPTIVGILTFISRINYWL